MQRGWLFLILAIVAEVSGTMTMNASSHSGHLGIYILMYAFICLSYFFLSFALRSLSIGVAIAIWEGLGTAFISILSVVLFDEKFSVQKILGISIAVVGVFILHMSERSGSTTHD